jgi:quercetin 2,3-dioxygenase
VRKGDETVEMLQIFVRPKADDLPPMVQFHEPDEPFRLNSWRLLAGHERSDTPFQFRSELLFYDARLEKGQTLHTPDINEKTGFLYLFSGSVMIDSIGKTVSEGDSVIIKDEHPALTGMEDADLVFFILDEEAPYSRNGLYTK